MFVCFNYSTNIRIIIDIKKYRGAYFAKTLKQIYYANIQKQNKTQIYNRYNKQSNKQYVNYCRIPSPRKDPRQTSGSEPTHER